MRTDVNTESEIASFFTSNEKTRDTDDWKLTWRSPNICPGSSTSYFDRWLLILFVQKRLFCGNWYSGVSKLDELGDRQSTFRFDLLDRTTLHFKWLRSIVSKKNCTKIFPLIVYLFELRNYRLNKDMIFLHGIKYHVIFLLNDEIFRI